MGKRTKLNGEAIASITKDGYFLLECQDDYIAFSNAGIKALKNVLDKWYEEADKAKFQKDLDKWYKSK